MIKISSIDRNIEESEQPVRNAFIFLLNHSRSPDAFSKEDFKNFANYPNPDNFDTYYSKKFRHFLEEAPNDQGKFLVSGIFKKRFHVMPINVPPSLQVVMPVVNQEVRAAGAKKRSPFQSLRLMRFIRKPKSAAAR